jgi:hypothetical protein
MAVIGSLGIVVRMFVRFSVMPGVELTPGFMFSELGGLVGGLPGGVLVGAIVGVGGAMAGGEMPLLPLVGNVCLGLGTGTAVVADPARSSIRYYVTALLGGAVIGGFIPTMTIFSGFEFAAAFIPAIVDSFQAFIWAAVALSVERGLIRPVVGHYLYRESESEGQQAPIEVNRT